jgi:hypothetical protein
MGKLMGQTVSELCKKVWINNGQTHEQTVSGLCKQYKNDDCVKE